MIKTRSKIYFSIIANLVFASICIGQFLRPTLTKPFYITFLTIDIVTILLDLFFLILLIVNKKIPDFFRKIWSFKPWRYMIIFLAWSLISFGLRFTNYPLSVLLNGFSYWIRLALVFFLGLNVYYFFNKDDYKKITLIYFSIWSGLALLLGFIQLIFIPNFSFMAKYGWDPHVGRLLSTFFDPNFFGAFLALVMSIALGYYLYHKPNKKNFFPLILLILSWIGLYLTYSRSAWVTGAIALFITAWPKNWKYSLLIATIFTAGIFIPSRLGSRFSVGTSAIRRQTIQTNVTQTSPEAKLSGDPSANARTVSLKRGLVLAEKHWLIGVGYNMYGYSLEKDKIVPAGSVTDHSRQGSDSSLLNIFATTGIIGLSLFILFLFSIIKNFYSNWKQKKIESAFFGFTIAWVLTSFFNNTLLYALILVPFVFLSAIFLQPSQNKVS